MEILITSTLIFTTLLGASRIDGNQTDADVACITDNMLSFLTLFAVLAGMVGQVELLAIPVGAIFISANRCLTVYGIGIEGTRGIIYMKLIRGSSLLLLALFVANACPYYTLGDSLG